MLAHSRRPHAVAPPLTPLALALTLTLAALAPAGCVTTSKHQTALRQCTDQRAAEIGKREARIKALEARIAGLETDLKSGRRSAAERLEASQAELEELRQQRAATEARLAEFKKLTARFQKMIDAGKLKVQIRHGQMMISLPSGVLFPSGKAELMPKGEAALTSVAETLKEFSGRRILVAGHTDSVPIKRSETFKDNWELSCGRALTVTRFLIDKGLDPRNIGAAGYAKYDPARSNRTRTGRKLNRRIELILVPNLAELPKLPAAAGE